MKILNMGMLCLLFLYGCANAQENSHDLAFATLPHPKEGEQVATFAGGCFWSMSEALFELKGVSKVVAGYAGGTIKNPSYQDVCTKLTGHAESVQVYYDPSVISYATLAEAFFYAHDPTTVDRQGPDEGPDYRSIAFYRNLQEKQIIEQVITKVNNGRHYEDKIVTQLLPLKVFYPAENYHQGYYRLHGDNPYIRQVSMPKVLKLRKAMNNALKAEFKQNT
jgi:peptide-methionine (S)-S-oxide reductase